MKKVSNEACALDAHSSPVQPSDFEADGLEVQSLRPWGIGLDVHKMFIQLSVIVKKNDSYYEYRKEFKTTWDDVCNAKEWAISIIETQSEPKLRVTDSDPFRYCLESTAQYHEIVVRAWKGEPELINPLLAGATLKKTDYPRKSVIRGDNSTSLAIAKFFLFSSEIKYHFKKSRIPS